MKKLLIYKNSIDSSLLNDFFEFSFPKKLKLFCLNREQNSNPNLAFNMPYFATAMECVTDEIFISFQIITYKNFEKIMKASSQCGRLKFYCCTIDTSNKLDFNNTKDYKIRYLGMRILTIKLF